MRNLENHAKERSASQDWALRVLVVEDNPQAAQALTDFLRWNGCIVSLATDGPSALEQARTTPPDAMLLDIGLPGMDGWQVAKELRQHRSPKQPLIIAVTALGTVEDKLRSFDAGIDLHLTKPADLVELSRLLRRFQGILSPY